MINKDLYSYGNQLRRLTRDLLYNYYIKTKPLAQRFYQDFEIYFQSIINRLKAPEISGKLAIAGISIIILTLTGMTLLLKTSEFNDDNLNKLSVGINKATHSNLIKRHVIERNNQYASKDESSYRLASTQTLSQIDIPLYTCLENTVFVSHEETPIFTGPDADLPHVQDKNGNSKLLDPRHDLKILNKINDWLEISIATPNWPPTENNVTGWLHKISLQKEPPDKNYKCLYIDFSKWRGIENKTRNLIKDNAARVLKIDRRCRRIVQGGLQLPNQRYYLTCYPADGGKPYHYWFSFQKSEEFIAIPKISPEAEALQSCDTSLQTTLKNKFTIDHTNTALDNTIIPELRILGSSFESTEFGWQIKMMYTFNASNETTAYCFYGPSKKAEIFL